MKILKKVKRGIKRIFDILKRPDMLILPGQLAFFLLLAMVPTITLITYGASLFNVSMDFISNFILKAFGENVSELIMPILTDIKFTPNFLIPLLIAFYTASGGASSIIVTSNQLYGFKNTGFVKRKIKGLIMIFILVSLVVFLLLIPGFGDKFIELVRYVNMISDAANQIHDAKDNEQIRMGFYLFNVSVDMLREYLAAHWWQYGGQSSRRAIDTVPKVNKLLVTS